MGNNQLKPLVDRLFDLALATFVKGCQRIHSERMACQFPNSNPDEISYTTGKRYARIVRSREGGAGRLAHCFVDLTNGDVLLTASWMAPTRHARGNIFDEHNGLKSMGEYGPAYLR